MNPDGIFETLMTERELCKALRISAAMAARMRYEGTGPRFVVLGSRRVAYRPTAVAEWLAAREVQQGVAHDVHAAASAEATA
jgi:predicted DNA-binding transcriptional regulator AlpA